MATRTSTTWSYKNGVEVKASDKVSSANMPNYLLNMTGKDITFDFFMSLFGHFNGKNIANPYDILIVPKGTFKYKNDKGEEKTNSSEFTTTIGLYIFNLLLANNDMTKVVGYVNKNLNKKKYAKLEQKMTYALIEDEITVEQFKQWQMVMQWLMPLQNILSCNHDEKMLLVSKAIAKKKAELLKENKEAIDAGDAKVIEKIEKELIQYAKDYIGDDSCMDSLNSGAGASFGNQFKNMYIIKGAIANPDPNAKQKYNIITDSYIEGVSAQDYPLLGQSGANGSYSRSKKTSIGGYWEKLFVNSMQHIKLDPDGSDCGTNRYIEVILTEDNIDDYIYSYAITSGNGLELITSKNCEKYYGKKTKIRFSSMCESKTGICSKCAGKLLYIAGSKNIGTVTADVPDRIKNIAMKAFHDSTVTNYVIDDVESLFYPDK